MTVFSLCTARDFDKILKDLDQYCFGRDRAVKEVEIDHVNTLII